MGITDETALSRRVAYQTAVITGYPDASVPVLTEAGDHIARQPVIHGEAVEPSAHWREIFHAAIEGAYPQSAFRVAGDGIHKTVVKFCPLTCLWVQTYHTVVTTDADVFLRQFIEGVDMPSHFRLLRIEYLLQCPVVVHQQQSVLPGAKPEPSVFSLEHTE